MGSCFFNFFVCFLKIMFWANLFCMYGNRMQKTLNLGIISPFIDYFASVSELDAVPSQFTDFINVHGTELSRSSTIQDLKCSNVLVCVNKRLSATNIIIRICHTNEVSFNGQACLPCTSFSPGPWFFTRFLQGTP
jgi:hypothetical protein